MGRVVLILSALLLMQVSARAEDPAKDAKKRVEHEAERVWLAFGDGVAPAVEVGREARRVLEAFVAELPEAKRTATRLHTDSADVLLAKAAWAAGDLETARSRAEAVLVALRSAAKDWDSGNILHEMRILLGRVALESGDLDEADRQLLRAARTPGSPQLDSFGPDWTLARDLLALGHREAVSVYLLRVGTFWESGREQLAEWKKTLSDGDTPKFLPERKSLAQDPKAPKVRRNLGEPAAVAMPTGLVGFWEVTTRSNGGIGHVLDFRADGTVVQHMAVLVEAKYRIDGDTLILDDGIGDPDTTMPLGKIEGDTWTITGEGQSKQKARVGAAAPAQAAIVGVWTYDHGVGLGSKAFERFDANGWMRFRMLLPGTDSGSYEQIGKTLRLTFDAEPVTHTMTITGDHLRLVSDDDEREYRYIGASAWYVPLEPAKKG